MTQEEYLQLLNACESYKAMSQDLKDKIINAQGAQRESYIKIFQDELALVHKAYKDFVQKNEQIMTEFKVTVKDLQVEKRKMAEKAAQTSDQAELKSLIDKIDKL